VFEGAYDYRRRFFSYSPRRILSLAAALRRKRYDVVHTHLFHADVIGRTAGLLAGVPVIVKSLHNMGRWKPARYVALDRLLNRWTDKIICCSDYQREAAAVQEGFAAEAAVTIPHGVDLKGFEPQIDRARYAADLGLTPGRLVVGTVGRLIPEKGHADLVDAIPRILDQHPETEFMIVGDGALRQSLESRTASAECRGRVHLVGARTDISQLLSMMDIFVFPSLSEGFPVAVVEAMASRLPVVTSSIRPLRDTITDGVTGLLVPPGDSAALAGALNRLLSDAALRRRLAAGGRDLVAARYTDRRMVAAYEDLYVDLLRAAAVAGRTEASRSQSANRHLKMTSH
jgi:glycosyltransferase involved in cell wall biosynthesis